MILIILSLSHILVLSGILFYLFELRKKEDCLCIREAGAAEFCRVVSVIVIVLVWRVVMLGGRIWSGRSVYESEDGELLAGRIAGSVVLHIGIYGYLAWYLWKLRSSAACRGCLAEVAGAGGRMNIAGLGALVYVSGIVVVLTTGLVMLGFRK